MKGPEGGGTRMATKQSYYPVLRAGWIQIALIFLFNPLFGVVDVIPDAIGFVILIAAIRFTYDLTPRMAEAGRYFLRCAILNLAQYAGYVLVNRWSTGSTSPTLTLILVFTLSIGGAVFAYLGFRAFFEGIGELCAHGADIPDFLLPEKGRFSRLDKFRHLTYAMLIVKTFFNILPEFTSLSSSENQITSSWYQYINALRFLLAIPPLILGIIWLVKGLRLFGRIRKDGALRQRIDDWFSESVLPHPWYFLRHAYRATTVCLLAAAIGSINLLIAGTSYLPGFIAAAFFLAAWCCFRRYVKTPASAVILWAAFVAASAGAVAARAVFASRYEVENLSYVLTNDPTAWPAYLPALILSVAEYVLLAALWCRIWMLFHGIVDEHTGPFKRVHSTDPDLERRTVLAVQGELKRSLRFPIAASAILGAANVAYYALSPTYGFVWIVPILAGGLLIATTYAALSRVREGMERKYAFEDRDAGVETHAEID